MSHHGNQNLLEGHFEDGLDLIIDALGTKSFQDCPYDGNPDHKILFTGYDIYGHEELAEMYANQQFENGPDGPC